MVLWKSSKKRIFNDNVDSDIQNLIAKVESEWPFPKWQFQIGRTSAYRTLADQKALVAKGVSKTLKSKHMLGEAVDFTLYWEGTETAIWDKLYYCVVMGFVIGCAESLGIKTRWGADWNQNGILVEKKNWEVDFVHLEVLK